VDPQAYLKDVLERLPSMRSHEIDALLPEQWAAVHLQAKQADRMQAA
jgi:hypothetical protein